MSSEVTSSTPETAPEVALPVVEGLGGVGTGETVKVIDRVPGVEGSNYVSPDDQVAAINKDLASRDPNQPAPVVAAGDMVRHP